MLLFADSHDHYESTRGIYKYDRGTPPVGAALGRRGTQGLSWTTNIGGLVRNIGSQTTVIAGIALYATYTDYFPAANKHNGQPFTNLCTSRAWVMGLGYQGLSQMGLAFSADGGVHVIRGAALDLGANSLASELVASSSPGLLRFNQWVFLEMKITPTTAVVRLNGVQIINATVSTIQNGLPSSFTQFYCHGGSYELVGAGWAGRTDDLYVLNATGDKNNDFLGDVQIDYLKPDGVGTYSDSTIIGSNPAATRWQSVDDQTPDDAVTAVEFGAEGDRDSYTHEDVPYDSGTVFAVQGVVYARRQDAGLSAFRHTNRVNLTDLENTIEHRPAGGDYGYYLSPFDESADGAWTFAKVNDSEFGVIRKTV